MCWELGLPFPPTPAQITAWLVLEELPGQQEVGKVIPVPRDAPSPSPTWEAEWQQEQGSELHGHPQAQGRGITGGCPACPVPVWAPRDPPAWQ